MGVFWTENMHAFILLTKTWRIYSYSYTQVLRVGICVLIIGGWVSSAGVNCHNNITIKTDIQSFMTCKILRDLPWKWLKNVKIYFFDS